MTESTDIKLTETDANAITNAIIHYCKVSALQEMRMASIAQDESKQRHIGAALAYADVLEFVDREYIEIPF